ncbi:hypothetical protein DY000_02019064 [Brassica cretica]|uniref:Uncharacterized protein n=1 Tax=Brassica cretica TaxID=69181 RepID=A0ABQ7D202_BRACR|nr:hypothetical protein DY000_02019064 [Brassica cretica]
MISGAIDHNGLAGVCYAAVRKSYVIGVSINKVGGAQFTCALSFGAVSCSNCALLTMTTRSAAAVEQQLGESAQRIEVLDTTVAELNRKFDRLEERVTTIVATS